MSNDCNSETNMHMLTCSKCKQVIHYECTRLPEYQIYLFTRKNYRHYICEGCCGKIPNEILDNIKCIAEAPTDDIKSKYKTLLGEKNVIIGSLTLANEQLTERLQQSTLELEKSPRPKEKENQNLMEENSRMVKELIVSKKRTRRSHGRQFSLNPANQ